MPLRRGGGEGSRFVPPSGFLLLALLSCSGGGGDDVSFTSSPELLTLAEGVGGATLWSGVAVVPPACPGILALNAPLVFTFGGPVAAGSLPGVGPATGSINIVRTVGALTFPAQGGFLVEDDPTLPAGNARRAVFYPAASVNPAQPAATGFAGAATYTVFLPRAGTAPSVVYVGGAPLAAEVLTCFQTCDPAVLPCLGDPEAGPPFVERTVPETSDPAPPALLPLSITGNTVSVFFSEPLFPANVSLATVRLVDAATGAQVPGSVAFFQAGTPEAGPRGSRIDYVATGQLLPGTTYELLLAPVLQDFAANAVVPWAPGNPGAPPSGRRLFATTAAVFCPQAPIAEDFATTANRASVSGGIRWSGDGVVAGELPPELLSNGLFGALGFGAGPSTLDGGAPAIVVGGVTAFEKGTWNATTFTVGAGANVRCIGPYRFHVRCTGAASIAGTLNGTAGNQPTAPTGNPEQGARAGNFNNGNPGNPTWVAGGVANAGGGRGGHASQADMAGPALRTPRGEDGFGPTLDGQPNSGPAGANPLFGGGQGGEGAFVFPQGGVSGFVGGTGGAGGSAFFAGGNGGPFLAAPACTPVTPTPHVAALSSGVPAAFQSPVSLASAGSGGGGGGDKFDPAGVANDDQAGGGGGGGGGLRVTTVGGISVPAGASIRMSGGIGGQGNVFQAGHGGGGSGGEIWLQSFGEVVIAAAATLAVDGGAVNNACGNQGAGPGGAGLYQFEDRDGVVNTAFLGIPAGGGNVVVVPFPFATQIQGTAVSVFLDSGYGAPDWTSASAQTDPGNAPQASVTVVFQGAREALGGGPDPATITAPVAAQDLSQLDTYRYIRFVITTSFATPASFPPPPFLPPLVDGIQIFFSAPLNCP